MMVLYQRTDCPFCWKLRIALAELGLQYGTVETQLGENHPKVLSLSPTGTVPVLVDAELAIWESGVILEYLDIRYASGRLFTRDPVAQAKIRLLHAYSDKVVGGYLRDLVFEKRSKPECDWNPETIRSGTQAWRLCMAYLEAQLASQQYFGNLYSAADCALAARFGVAEVYGLEVTDEFPWLLRWYGAVTSRPSWEAAYPISFVSDREHDITRAK